MKIKKIISKVLASFAFTGALVAGFLFVNKAFEVKAAPIVSVTLYDTNGENPIALDITNPYLVNNVVANTGTLGEGGCTAFMDVANGILYLEGYNYGPIAALDGTNNDLKISISGTNKITNISNDLNKDIVGLYSKSGLITVESADNGSLELDIQGTNEERTDTVRAIGTGYVSGTTEGQVKFAGNANINVIVQNAGTGKTFGVWAYDGIYFEGSVNVSIVTKATADITDWDNCLHSSYSTYGITFNTTGNIYLDNSYNEIERYSNPVYSNKNQIEKIGSLVLKYDDDSYGYDSAFSGTVTYGTKKYYEKTTTTGRIVTTEYIEPVSIESYDFGTFVVGYSDSNAIRVKIHNHTNVNLNYNGTFVIQSGDTENFKYGTDVISSLLANNYNDDLWVRVKAGSPVGTYTLNVNFDNGEGYLASGTVTYKVVAAAESHTISFDKNDGTGTMENVIKQTGDTFELPSSTFTAPEDYTFKCWEIEGKEYVVGDTISIHKDLTIKAVWKINVVSVVFNETNLTMTGSNKATFGQDYVVTLTPEENYVVSLWPAGLGVTAYKHSGPETLVYKTDWDYNKDTKQITVFASAITEGFAEELRISATAIPSLILNDSDSYNIPAGLTNTAIDTIDISSAAEGGKTPYTFSLYHDYGAVKWLSVSADGKITGTRPTTEQEESTICVQVEDKDGNKNTMYIDVGVVSLPIYVVTFDENGKTAENIPANQNIKQGQKVEEPATTPTTTGWTFAGWYKEAECTNAWSFETDTVTIATTLYAKWEINTYTITVTAGENGTITPNANQTVNHGGEVTFTITANTGYKIKDVKVNGSSVGTVANYTFEDVTANATISAEFEALPTTLTASYNGTVLAGNKLSIPSLTVKVIYSDSSEMPCAGLAQYWYNGSQIQDPINYVFGVELIGNLEITVKYLELETTFELQVVGHEITFNSNTGTGSMEADEYVGAYTLPSNEFTAPTGKQFKGWSLTSNGEVLQGATYNVTEPVEFFAIWEDIPATPESLTATYTGTILAGTTINPAGISITLNYSDDSNEPVNAGNVEYWYGGSEITNPIAYVFGVELIGNLNITIKYEGLETTMAVTVVGHAITFNANTGTGIMEATEYVGAYTLPSNEFTAPTGKQFKGWATSSNGSVIEEATYNVTAPVEFFAIWEDIPVVTYTVTFNANGGTGTMTEVSNIAGNYTLPANGFTAPEGKHFKGWATSATGNVIEGATYNVTSDTTLYAIWEANSSAGPATPEQPENNNPTVEPESKGLGAGAIVGIVMASLVVLGTGGFAVVWFIVKKKTWADFVAIFKKK